MSDDDGDYDYHGSDMSRYRTLVHTAPSQEELHASVVKHTVDPGYELDVAMYNPVVVHAYPRVSAVPPFPFTSLAPIQQLEGLRHDGTVDPYIRSAVSLSYTRSLELLRRQLGPHFELEKLWELHTFYVSEIASLVLWYAHTEHSS